ncbi:MAG: ParB/RepB/Spo0J family partition protein [Prevotella sp.]|jgi:ParB family chromosome partitioning protein|nr:ParB/RepB/Spo0J family partition protein [Prevotella sp.]
MSKKPSALGRGFGDMGVGMGIGALLSDATAVIKPDSTEIREASSIDEIPLAKIRPNPDQPRRIFDEDDMAELTASIRQIGVITPITLRKLDDGDYQIIAGERRYRASIEAGLESIPAYIIKASDEEIEVVSLIENIQRKDLTAIEIAIGYQKIIQRQHLTQEELGKKVSKKRATIANHLRLLNLPAEIQMGITNGKIDMGHARELVSISDPLAQLQLYELIVEEGLSVRKVEEYAAAIKNGESLTALLDSEKEQSVKKANGTSKPATPEEYAILGQKLSKLFHAKVQLSCNDKGKGKISIAFGSDSELERIMTIFDNLKSK